MAHSVKQRGLSQSKGHTSNFNFFGSVNLQESAEKYERVLLTSSFSEKIHFLRYIMVCLTEIRLKHDF